MSISRLEYTGRTAGIQQTALQLNQRAVGQVMSIREGGLLDVSIGGRAYQAYSTVAAKPGDTLQLKLVSLQPQPLFTVLDQEESSDTGAGIKLDLSGFSANPGRSLSLSTGLAGLYQLLAQLPAQPAGRVAAEIQRLLNILEQYRIDSRDLQSSGLLKQQALGSGIFLEAMMAAGYPASMLVDDIKAQLYKTLRRLQPNRSMQYRDGAISFAPLGGAAGSPSNNAASVSMGQVLQAYMDQQEPDEKVARAGKLLGQNLENTLTQLVGKQLSVVAHQEQNKLIWSLDLLVRNGEETLTIPVTVGCHKLAGEDVWAVSFTLELIASGKLQVDMHINHTGVDLNVVNDRPVTRDRLLYARPALEKQLGTAGLTLESLSSSLEAAC